MDQNEIRKVIVEATKSLTVHDVEVVEAAGISVHFRIIAEAYGSQVKSERVVTVLKLIEAHAKAFSDQHLFSVDPFTPQEFDQFYDRRDGGASGQGGSEGQAAKPAEV